MFEFKLPDIGEGLHEAELLQWDVKVGDQVEEGQSIAQISTDKVNVELPSPRAGVIRELPWQPGDIIAVGAVFARIEDGRDADPEQESPDPKAPVAPTPARQAAKPVKAPPVVRKYAAENDVDLGQVEATGAGGMVSKADVDAYLAGSTKGDAAQGMTRMVLSGPRLAAAKRLEESWRTMATTAMSFEVAADGILNKADDSGAATPLAVIAQALCRTLAAHPEFNAVIDEVPRALDVYEDVHLGLAVDSPDGLLVPVIRNANQKSLEELNRAIAETAEKARAGSLQVADYQNSTFTLSSTGGIEESSITATTPVINFPNVATLWVSRISRRPRVILGRLESGPMMNGTLAFDHRFLQGADATRFINTFTDLLNPGG